MDYQSKTELLRIRDIKNKYEHLENTKLRISAYNDLLEDERPILFIEDKPFYIGKVRSLYNLSKEEKHCNNTFFKILSKHNNLVIMKISDKLSGFDRYLCTVPLKGLVLDSISNWWMEKTCHLVPNHLIYTDINYITVAHRCKPFPVEFVMRSYMTGSTSTSIWQNYKKHMNEHETENETEIGYMTFCGNEIRSGYKKNDRLDKIILTPTTKSNEHDAPTSVAEIVETGVMSKEHMDICIDYAFKLFKFGQRECNSKGLILVDTKYEFGLDDSGRVVLIDELHTPDSSRYWLKHSYDELHEQGKEPEHIDKEFIRKWVKKTYGDPYKEGLEIEIPEDMILTMASRYLMLHELITGKELHIH